MLPLNLQNRVDTIFLEKKRQSAEVITGSAHIAHNIYAYLEHCGFSVSYNDVEARVSFLIAHTSVSGFSSFESKPGRPVLWHLKTKQIRIPEKYAAALIEIAREWQENEFGEAPF